MGGQQSRRSTQFQRSPPEEDDTVLDETSEEHHISISNKMVERLVEDATLAGGAAAATSQPIPKGDYKDKMYMERLRCMDEKHSERTGLTVEDLHSLAARIDIRTANMVSVEPVCEDCHDKVIECYNNYDQPEDNIKCWDTVGAFSACVHAASARRLRARTVREARESARRERHMALAREHELKDLARPHRDEATPA